MKPLLFTVNSEFDGLPLSAALFVPDNPRALVLFSHGMCEHKQRYFPLMEHLAGLGLVCAAADHRGHGQSVRSAQDLGFFGPDGQGAEGLLRDLHQIAGLLRARFPGLPLFLFGHSMGSLAARCYARRWDSDLSGLIVCGSPSYNPAAEAGLALCRVLARFAGPRHRSLFIHRMMFGSFNRAFGRPQESAWLCSDPAVVRRYDEDPLCGFVFTLNGFESLLLLMRECYTKKGWAVSSPDMPVLFISGAQDPCRISDRHFFRAVELMRSLGYRHVGQKLYPGLRHEILNEPCPDVWSDVSNALLAWSGADTFEIAPGV